MNLADLDELIEEITVDAYGDDEKLWAFRQAFEDDVKRMLWLAGDFTVIDDELVDALLSILRDGDESAKLRGKAAISLGPVLEHADMDGFEDADDVPIAERAFHRIQASLRKLYMDADVPKNVRRRQDWHSDAVRAAYGSDDEAVGGIRPHEAAGVLDGLTSSEDEDIVGAVFEAAAMAEGASDEDDEDDERRH